MEKPLAQKLAPKSLKDVIGQEHLIGENKIISNMVKNKRIFSMILYGEPGIGKTSIANALLNDLGERYRFLNAVINNKKDFDVVLEEAKMYGGIILVVDEIHRLNKDKQDILLPYLESGLVILIGLTTSNPYHRINPAIRSRCQIFKLNPLTAEDIFKALKKAIKHEDLKNIKTDDETLKFIASISKFDLRFAYNFLEVCYYSTTEHIVNKSLVENINPNLPISLDKNESGYYDSLSGLQKSIRGSDVHASLHYLARLLTSEDLDSIYRRLSVICYEDIGLANPNLGPRLKACIDLCELVGLPEARIILSNIVIDMALSPKSNTAYLAIDKAINDIQTKDVGEVPSHIKSPYINYKYPHDYKFSIVKQEYLPENLLNTKYYIPKASSKYEQALMKTIENIENLKNKENN